MFDGSSVPAVKLNDGTQIPALAYGLGTARYKATPGDIDRSLVEIIKLAIKNGYYHLDGAEVYGNEAELGVAIKESGVPREKLYVTTKVYDGIPDIPAALDASLEKLQLAYVDQFLIHHPFFATNDEELQSKWKDMENIQKSGKAKTIGVSNFFSKHLEAILKTADVIPAIDQVEFHPYLQHPDLLALARKHNITISAYGPQSTITKAKGGPVDALTLKLATKYGVSDGEIALRWVIDQGIVAVTTTGKEERMKQYLGVFSFKLTPEEVKELSDLGSKKHFRGFWTEIFDESDRT